MSSDPSPALEPEPVSLTRCTYTVVGALPVYGTQPGGTFTATLTAAQEQLLVDGGHITRNTKGSRTDG